MTSTLKTLAIRVKDVWQKEGLLPLLRRGFTFLAQSCFQYGTFYLYQHTMKERSDADFMPKIQNFTFEIVSTNQQADELAANGDDIRAYSYYARRSLDQGAIAFCVFVGQELAHIGWLALTKEAMATFGPYPYRVNFSGKEAYTGGTLTMPKYRGKGLMGYGYFKRFQFLWERGIAVSRNVVATNNIASQRVMAKFGPQIPAQARYLRILWWQFWKETPLAPTSYHDQTVPNRP